MDPIADIIAIEQLAARYNYAIDGRDADAWAETFVPDGVFEAAGAEPVRGRDALRAFVRSREGSARHFISNPAIDVDGDTATMRVYLELVSAGKILITGHYDDTLRKVDGEWRFVTRHVTPDPRPVPA